MAAVANTRALGAAGERIAAEYLGLGGWEILDRNWRSGPLEIDLVAAKDGDVAFVEVRTRRSGAFGGAVASIDARKLRNMRRAAGRWLAKRRGGRWRETRCDLVAIDIDSGGGRMSLSHLRGVDRFFA